MGCMIPGLNPGVGEIFCTSSGAHPASYTMDTGSFPGLKQQGHGIDHPPPSSAEVKERVGPSNPILGLRGLF